jgi:SAM-dependent methyltransferase
MKYFQNRDFVEAKETVVGFINNIPTETRWEHETPVFAEAILKNLPPGGTRILDYGCGVGRLSKAILSKNTSVTLLGVDNSSVQLEHARNYVDSQRFATALPHHTEGVFDLAYCIYVLQHVRAVDIRHVLETIHAHLTPNGVFVHCSSIRRMSVRDDTINFFNDTFLGVNLNREISRLFEPVGELFDDTTLQANEIVRRMVIGQDGREEPDDEGNFGDAHPAHVYRRREISTPYYLLPCP